MTPGWTQRWNTRQQSWRHRCDGGFNPRRYAVLPLPELQAREFVTTHHYAGTWPAARLRYGLIDQHTGGQLVGAVVLGVPMHPRVLTGPLPDLEPYTESLELSRLVLLDQVPANAESWTVARAFALAAAEGVRGIVAFADPVPRRRHGTLVMPGHVGTVYQALNATYTGRGTRRSLVVLPDGTTLTARSRAKVTGAERGGDAVIARLVALGAAPPAAGQDRAGWIALAIEAIGARRLRHPGNHRYVFRTGRTRAERTRTVIGLRARPYPKRHTGQLTLFDTAA